VELTETLTGGFWPASLAAWFGALLTLTAAALVGALAWRDRWDPRPCGCPW
jgi:hypothetical protein